MIKYLLIPVLFVLLFVYSACVLSKRCDEVKYIDDKTDDNRQEYE